jgi:hypothetical protein
VKNQQMQQLLIQFVNYIWYLFFFFNKIYLKYVNTLTTVLDNTKIVPGQPISCRTLAVRGGHGTTSSGYGRYSSEKMAQKKKHCSGISYVIRHYIAIFRERS